MSTATTFVARVRRRVSVELAVRIRSRPVIAQNQRPMISFTFDDVPESAVSNGALILKAHGVRGTFYIAGGLCGTRDALYSYLTREQLIELHRDGHEIGCHTFSHPNLRRLDRDELAREVALNRQFFAGLAGIQLDNFAYPSGATSLRRRRQLQHLFSSCRSTVPGINAGTIDLDYLRSVELCHGHISVRQAHALIAAVVGVNGWLIFLTHDVTDRPSRWGCTPEFLAEVVAHALESGCDVVTVREALVRVRGRQEAAAVGLPSLGAT